MSSAAVELSRLRSALEKATDASTKLDVLKALSAQTITLDDLAASKIGVIVSGLRNEEGEMGTLAKSMVKKWKQMRKNATPVKSEGKKGNDLKNGGGTPTSAAASTDNNKAKNKTVDDGAFLKQLTKDIGADRVKIFNVLKKAFLKEYEQCEVLKSIKDETSREEYVKEKSLALEEAIDEEHNSVIYNKDYLAKVQSLVFNIKKNPALRSSVLEGKIPITKLVKMNPAEFASQEQIEKANRLKQEVQDASRLDWDTDNLNKINDICGIDTDDFLFTCGACKGTRTVSHQQQTRSADEPMTIFVTCLDCGKKWKC